MLPSGILTAMTLCYYVTGHGYGHAIRTAQVLKALPASLPLMIKTTVPQQLFREELLNRSFDYYYAEYDSGCIQPDSVTILKRETLDRFATINAENRKRLDSEIQFLVDHGVRLVVSDVPSFPLMAARAAGIPAVATTNFTWCDIYNDYVETEADQALIQDMAMQYGAASLALISDLHLPTTTSVFPHVEHVPLTVRKGVSRRAELDRRIDNNRHLGLLYLGTWGLDIDWAAVESLVDWRFLSYEPTPRKFRNVDLVSRQEWMYEDIVASVDAMICKVGYGAVTDCIGNSTPMVHLPRRDFIEYSVLVAGMDRWGGRVELSELDFVAGRWKPALDTALRVEMRADAFRTDGAQVIASRLLQLMD